MTEQLAATEQEYLLSIARDAIVAGVCGRKAPAVEPGSPNLSQENGCFVSVKQQGRLRGCIGNFVSDKPLYLLVQEMGIAAATKDPRFYPMKEQDLADFKLEISVLSPLRKVESVKEIVVGTHGIYIVKNASRGVLLPQVAVEYGWDLDTFLGHTCLKAGLPEKAWQKDCDIYIFSAQVFSEK
jgi:uncharacterized protein